MTDPSLADAAPNPVQTGSLVDDATGVTIRAPRGAAGNTAAPSDGTQFGYSAIAASGVQKY